MKICSNCHASNPDSGKFCSECGTMLVASQPLEGKQTRDLSLDAQKLATALTARQQFLHSKRKADILFILDCTGSMRGEIDAIRDSILAFADTIESDGVRARVGLIEFRDRLAGEEARVLTFNGEVFTADPALFRQEVTALQAAGGGDDPESSLDAIMLALQQPFAPDSDKVLVLVTDAPPHIPDKETRSLQDVIWKMRAVGIGQFYIVMNTQDPDSQVYLELFRGIRGLAFDLGSGDDFRSRSDHFKRTLMSLGKTISAATR